MAIQFDTHPYEHAHGKMPRGYGRWGFSFDTLDPKLEDIFWCTDSYSEAKKAAHAEGKKRGAQYIMVLS